MFGRENSKGLKAIWAPAQLHCRTNGSSQEQNWWRQRLSMFIRKPQSPPSKASELILEALFGGGSESSCWIEDQGNSCPVASGFSCAVSARKKKESIIAGQAVGGVTGGMDNSCRRWWWWWGLCCGGDGCSCCGGNQVSLGNCGNSCCQDVSTGVDNWALNCMSHCDLDLFYRLQGRFFEFWNLPEVET